MKSIGVVTSTILVTGIIAIVSVQGSNDLCLPDDRVPSNNPHVARVLWSDDGCTVFRVGDENVFLTAGHCIENALGDHYCKSPASNPQSIYVEFNVPLSQKDGTPVRSSPEDQFKIQTSSIVCEHQGGGHDWAVFTVHPNEKTNKMPSEMFGSGMKVTDKSPRITTVKPIIGIIGYGDAEAELSLTQQFAIGPIHKIEKLSANELRLVYNCFTEHGVSGGPVIHESKVIGIHNSGFCLEGIGTPLTNLSLNAVLHNRGVL